MATATHSHTAQSAPLPPLKDVVAQLLADSRFRASPALYRLLGYLADATERCDAGALKEYAIGVDVFGRRADFDPATDPIVRVQAHRLRLRLADWYAGPGREDPVVLDLPRGGYRLHAHAPMDRIVAPGAAPPHPLGALFGRDAELARLTQALAKHRLVTLVGPPGIGKTRLALAAAHQLTPAFADGARFLSLDRLAEPSNVPEALVAALGKAVEDRHAGAPDAARLLRTARLLLVLDNAEHLIEAVAELARAILDGAPEVFILATSREPLRLFGEMRITPEPLSAPPAGPLSPGDLAQWPATALFLDRAAEAGAPPPASVEDAQAVAAICRRLDGVPLAIELAASRTAMLLPAEIEAALARPLPLLAQGERAGPDRHRTLAAALDWSYALLSAEDRLLLRCLSVFAGSFDIAAAEAVAEAQLGGRDAVFEHLASLVDKSLVAREPRGAGARFRLLAITRGFAAALRSSAGERAGFAAMAQHYARWLRALKRDFEFGPSGPVLARLEPELDNIRAAIDWAHRPDGDTECALELTANVLMLLLEIGLVAEVRRLIARAAPRISETTPKAVAAILLHADAFQFSTLVGNKAGHLARASALARASGDPIVAARVMLVEVQALRATAPERVKPQTDGAMALLEPLGASKTFALGMLSRALTHAIAGRHDAALADVDRGVAMLRALQHHWGLAYGQVLAVEVAVLAGDFERAIARGRNAVAAAERPGIRAMGVFASTCLAGALFAAGRAEEALPWARGALLEALAVDEEVLQVSAAALVAHGLAPTAPESALRLLGWCDAVRSRLQQRPRPSEAAARAVLDAALGDRVPGARLQQLMADGAGLTALEAIALARQFPDPAVPRPAAA